MLKGDFKQAGNYISSWQTTPSALQYTITSKNGFCMFHMINDQQDTISMRECNIFSAGFPQLLQLWSHSRSYFSCVIKTLITHENEMIRTWNLSTEAEAKVCNSVNWQNWHLHHKWIRLCVWVWLYVCVCLPTTYSQWLTQRASAYTTLHPTGVVTESPRETAHKHPCYSQLLQFGSTQPCTSFVVCSPRLNTHITNTLSRIKVYDVVKEKAQLFAVADQITTYPSEQHGTTCRKSHVLPTNWSF